MEEVYALHQHKYCAVIYFTRTRIYITNYETGFRIIDRDINYLSKKASITYSQQTQKVLSWGDASFEEENNETDIRIDRFLDGLYELFKKDKKIWNENDMFLKKAVSDFISLAINELMGDKKIVNRSLDSFHYGFIIPSEWEEEIREDLIRPIFIQAGLLSKDDHNDRLLFISDVECVFYDSEISYDFERGQSTILVRAAHFDEETVLVKLDLIKTSNTLFDFSDSMLFPKVMKSSSFYIDFNDIKSSIEIFLKKELLIKSNDQDETVPEITELIFNNIISDRDESFEISDHEKIEPLLMKPMIQDTTKWVLNNSQETFLKSICGSNIWSVIGKKVLENIKDLLSNSLTNEYELLICLHNFFSDIDLNDTQKGLLRFMLECSIYDLKQVISLTLIKSDQYNLSDDQLTENAFQSIKDTTQNSEMYSAPRIIPTENPKMSPSVFINSKPDVIINIDISFKSTVISHSFLEENGSIKEPFDQNYFVADKWFPSLENFYTISSSVTLKLGEKFIPFADIYLSDKFNYLTTTGEFLSKMEEFMKKDYSNEDKVSFICHKKYIKAFFLMYLVYIKELILSKLPARAKLGNATIKIGHVISIEKYLLNKIIGDKADLQQLVYKSGLVDKNDSNSRLRIITQGEGILSMIQTMLKVDFLVRSYFVLAQLHEDYIQLTLNQIVTKSSVKDEQQEAVIIEDRIIPIQNIYDSLCLNMWNNLTENSSLIELCHIHSKSGNDLDILELFSLKSRNEFMKNLKEYIMNNVLNSDSKLENIRKVTVNLNRSCNCKVHLKANDIISICFKPALQSIHTVMMSSFINENIFGEYDYIQYLFSIVHFNNNHHFEKIISTILHEKGYYSNPKRGIETLLIVIPKLHNLQSVHTLHSFFYKGFTVGTLRQLQNKNYGIKLESGPISVKLGSAYKTEITDTKYIDVLGDKLFPIFKKEDSLSDTKLNYVFYLNIPSEIKSDFFIELLSYETSDILQKDEVTSVEVIRKNAYVDTFQFNREQYMTSTFPVVFSIKYLGYSSSLVISAREIGQVVELKNITEIGNPLTLCRS